MHLYALRMHQCQVENDFKITYCSFDADVHRKTVAKAIDSREPPIFQNRLGFCGQVQQLLAYGHLNSQNPKRNLQWELGVLERSYYDGA
jgi:hypothetical protein